MSTAARLEAAEPVAWQIKYTSGIRLSDLIDAGNGIYIDTEELHRIAIVCMGKLASRANFYQARELVGRSA